MAGLEMKINNLRSIPSQQQKQKRRTAVSQANVVGLYECGPLTTKLKLYNITLHSPAGQSPASGPQGFPDGRRP